MQGNNYTPVDHLVKKDQEAVISAGQSKEAVGHTSSRISEKADNQQNKQEKLKRVEIHEFVEHQPHPNLHKYIKPRPDVVKIDKDLKQMGVIQSSPITFAVSQKINLPISDEKVLRGLHAPIRSSLRWLAQLCFYILEQAHITLKNVGGKPVRARKIN